MKCTLNENIKMLRTQMAMSQVELANALHVSKQCVSNWENDNIQPSIGMLIQLADLFRVSTDQLLGRCTEQTVDISALSEKQSGHIRSLINDLADLNENH